MPSANRTKRREEFMAMVRDIGELETTVLASDEPFVAPSKAAQRVARLFVGSVAGSLEIGRKRVERVAGLLQQLIDLDAYEKARRPPRKSRHA